MKVIREVGTSDATWARDVSNAMAEILDGTDPVGLAAVEHNADMSTAHTVLNALPKHIGGIFDISAENLLGLVGRETFRAYFHPRRIATSHTEIERDIPEEASAPARAFRKSMGYRDMVGMLAYPDPGAAIVLCAVRRDVVKLDLTERQFMTRVALHLQAAYRLRRRPDTVVAEIAPEGRVLHREVDAPTNQTLSAHVAQVERAQSRDGGMELWPALVDGRYSLVERGMGRSKRYLVIENAPEAQPMRALTSRQAEVVAQAARGLSAKMVGYAMGLSSSAVAGHLLEAAAKVGVASRLELVRVAAMLSRDPRAGFADTALTAAERDVLELLQLGLSNEEIAKMRSRSVRTIANQVASLLRKTGRPSRRGLFG